MMPLRPLYSVLLVSLLTLSACTATETSSASPPLVSGCNADAVKNLIGKPADEKLQQQAQTKAGASSARTLGPHDVATMDYNLQRLNLYTDDNRVIIRISCG
jgi:hypothetical protein